MTIADKLALLEQTKEAQRIKLGLPESLPFREYIKFMRETFTSADLFANGEQGVWLDPSDLSTMFQDVDGIKPVTKDGDPVGLILDKSQGAKPEYIFNKPLIDSLDGWYSREDRTNGNMILTPEGIRAELVGEGASASSQDNFIAIDLDLKKGVTYFFNAFAERDGLNGNPYLRLYDSNNSIVISMMNLHTNPQKAFTPEKDISVSCQVRSTSYQRQGILILKSLVIKAVAGNHATQPTASARPIYRTDGILHWLKFDGVDDHLIASSVELSGSYYITQGLINVSSNNMEYVVEGTTGAYLVRKTSGSKFQIAGFSEFYGLPMGNYRGKSIVLDAKFSNEGSYIAVGSDKLSGNAMPINVNGLRIGGTFYSASLSGFLAINGDVDDEGKIKLQDYLEQRAGVTL